MAESAAASNGAHELPLPAPTTHEENPDADAAHLVEDLSNLHVSVTTEPVVGVSLTKVHTKEAEDNFVHISTSDPTLNSSKAEDGENVDADEDDDDDVFASPMTSKSPFASFSNGVKKLASNDGTLTPNGEEENGANDDNEGERAGNRLIVEALVVRKMSLDEGFLDFGGFAMI